MMTVLFVLSVESAKIVIKAAGSMKEDHVIKVQLPDATKATVFFLPAYRYCNGRF
jgi:hypothetical protein